jgi:glucokinase
MAYALPTQRKENLEILQSGIERSGNRAVIAAGTGLGEALLFGDGKAWFPSASEGGHSDFAPTNEQQIDLLRFLQKKFDHISYERLLSGSGLQEIYNFVCSREKSTMGELLTAQQISDAALQKKSSQSIEALEIFVTIYAAEAANLVLKAMAIGGVYLGGGITEKILPLLKGKIFLQAFQNKGRYRQLMQEIPIKVLINPKVGPSVAMEGALNYLMSRA